MPHKINLLSWREEQRERHKKRFAINIMFGIVVALALQWLAGYYIDYQQRLQHERLDHLNTHIAKLDRKIRLLSEVEAEHKSILTKLAKVEELQNSRNKTTEFMNLMPELVPDGVYVDKIKMSGVELEITGISDSTARLATMLDNFESSDSITDVDMHSIVNGDKRFGRNFQNFSMSFRFISSVKVAQHQKDASLDGQVAQQEKEASEEEHHG